MNITIRLAVPGDVPDIAEVLTRSWEVAYKDIVPVDFMREKNASRYEQFKKSITDENTDFYIIQADDKVGGIIRVVDRPNLDDTGVGVADVEAIYLHPDYFRQGIGTKAMEFAYDIARGMGRNVVIIWVLVENHNARRFYEKCGFVADGKTRTWQYGKSCEGIRMRKDL